MAKQKLNPCLTFGRAALTKLDSLQNRTAVLRKENYRMTSAHMAAFVLMTTSSAYSLFYNTNPYCRSCSSIDVHADLCLCEAKCCTLNDLYTVAASIET